MSDIPGMIGDLAQGGLWARAAEPAHGEDQRPYRRRGMPQLRRRADRALHCHRADSAGTCTDPRGVLPRLSSRVFHFEGKIWRTLPMLAWRPGRLTREYVEGRRASYVSADCAVPVRRLRDFRAVHVLGSSLHLDNGIKVDAASGISQAKSDLDARVAGLEVKRNLAQLKEAAARLRSPDRATAGRQGRARQDRPPASGADGERQRLPAGEAVARGLNAAWIKAKQNPGAPRLQAAVERLQVQLVV